jgi:hypothetical protein
MISGLAFKFVKRSGNYGAFTLDVKSMLNEKFLKYPLLLK